MWIAVPLALVALGAGVFAALVATSPEVAMVSREAAAREVLVFVAEPVPVRRQWRGYGTAEADVSADVPARVTATVAAVPPGVKEGTDVEPGQVLVRLDPTDFERRVEQAEQSLAAIGAQLAQLAAEEQSLRERLPIEEEDVRIAERERERVRVVVERGAGNPQDLDAADRNVLAARRNRWQVTQQVAQLEARRAALGAQQSAQRAALRAAREDLTRTRIVSPIAGRLQAVPVKAGENVREGDVVARVANVDVIEVPLALPASARGSIRVGDNALIRAASAPELCWPATLDRVSPEDDPATRTMTAYLEVDQREAAASGGGPLLHPGRFVEAMVTSADAEPRWVVPRRSVRSGRVFIVEGGVLRSVPVEVDFALEGSLERGPALPDEQWAVLADASAGAALAEGALVVVTASSLLADGERVTPIVAGSGPTAAAGAIGRRAAAPGGAAGASP